MEYRLLGPLEVRRDGEPIEIGQYKLRALLTLLLIHADQVVSTDRLIDEIWGEARGDRQNSLWVSVSGLRSALDPDRKKRTDGTSLLTRSPGYLLATVDADVDVRRFERLAAEGRALLDPDPAAAALVLQEALSIWRGHALEEFTYEPWAQAEIARLEELRLTAVEDRVFADLRAGSARELVGELESLVRLHPLRERLTEHLMMALHRSGRQAEALRAFGALRGRLGEELGIEPSAQLTRLEERIVLDDPELAATSAAPGQGGGVGGLVLRGYELRDRLGENDNSFVYGAYQPAVGREVAVTVIRPALANDPAFIRRFEGEAQVVSQLEHPRIVSLYDYWREPDAAYLVTRRYEHGNLSDALQAGALATDMAVRVVEQVGGALAAAHRRGIAHGNVSPQSILLDSDHNAHLTGFSMPGSGGDFSAPEIHGVGSATSRSDVFSLGAVAAIVLRRAVGEHDAPLVGPAAAVVGRATAPDPAERHETVDDFIRELAAAIGSAPIATTPVENPYRGLRAFDEGDAGRFFGRERLVERLVARLGHPGTQGRLVALVGPSGAGKSSVVRAGLIPAIRSGALPGSDRWFVVAMTPGQHPFEALEDALLRVAVDPPPSVLERLLDRGIADTVSSLLPEEGTQLLLVVDQLEELFSHASPQSTDRFLRALAETAADAHAPVKVVATLRADFYDHPLRHVAFGELLRLGTEIITPMSAAELEQAIAAPAAEVGVEFERGLVSQIVADMQGQPAALPLLQYALTELFDARRGTKIGASAYEELGGVSTALVRRADRIKAGLDDPGQRAARDVFLRLVSLGEGAEDTRRRALLAELTDGGGQVVADVIDSFGRHRLLSFDRDSTTRGPTVELAHEALITEWTQLREWIADARSDVRAQRRLATAANDWRERDHDASYLLAGTRLARYADWDDAPPVRLTQGEGQFLAASNDAAEVERDVERRRVQRLRRVVAGALAALLVATVAGVFAFGESRRANDEAEAATAAAAEAGEQTRVAEAEAEAARAANERSELATLISRSAASSRDNPELAVLLALEANRRASSAETEQGVLNALGSSSLAPKLASFPPLYEPPCDRSVIGSDGFTAFAVVGGELVSRDVLTGEVVEHGPAPAECVQWVGDGTLDRKVAFTEDDGRFWAGPFDGPFDAERTFDAPTRGILSSFRPTGRWYVVSSPAGEPPEFSLLDDRTLATVGEPVTGGRNYIAAEFKDDGSLVALSFGTPDRPEGNGELVVVDGVNGDEQLRLAIPVPVGELIFDESVSQLLGATFDGRLITLDLASGDIVADVGLTAKAEVTEMEIGDDGLVTVISAGQLEVVDRMTGPVGEPVELRDVVDARIRPDGLLLSIEPGGATSVISLDTTSLVERSYDFDAFAQVTLRNGLGVSADFGANPPELVDLATGERSLLALVTPEGTPYRPFTVLPDRDGLWTYGADGAVTRWEDGSAVASVAVPGAAFSESWFDDRWLIMTWEEGQFGSEMGHVIALDPQGPTIELSVSVPEMSHAHPSPEGGLYAVTFDGVMSVFDADGEHVKEIETGLRDVREIAVDRASGRVALASPEDGSAIVDPATGEVRQLGGFADVVNLGFAQHGRFLALTNADGTVRLWDVERDASAGLVWDGTGARGGEPSWYDEDGDSVWVRTSGKIIEIPLDSAVWIERACAAVGRDFTEDEWDRLVPGDDEPLRSACE
jgi:DNA-binding SARP family transcriptional activator